MVKVGEVAFIKTTGEEAFVLNCVATGDKLGAMYDVRRPVGGQNGIVHLTERFYEAELESREERKKREASEREEFAKDMMKQPMEYVHMTEVSADGPVN
jgi:hypothetical protein